MGERDWLASEFEANRDRLRAVAVRMLGSASEAEDVVQDAWLRLCRSDVGGVDNLAGWLTTVVARMCLDLLRARKARREEPIDAHASAIEALDAEAASPEHELMLADAIGPALLVVLETLNPAERLAFVLHDMFGVSFEEIAAVVGRSPTAARQLASRARRRVQGADAAPRADQARQRQVVDAFLAASRQGDFAALLTVLDPDVVLHADAVAVAGSRAARADGAPLLEPQVRGADEVARAFSGRARGAQPALVDGAAGAAWAPGGTPRVAFAFTVANGRIVEIEVIADAASLAEVEVTMLDG